MILTNTALVTPENGPRQAGPPTKCLYCNEAVGLEHKPDCVCRKRTVVIEWRLRYVVHVPESWTKEEIEFHRNDGTWCANNDLMDLAADDRNDSRPCMCDITDRPFSFLREATEDDHEGMPVIGNDA